MSRLVEAQPPGTPGLRQGVRRDWLYAGLLIALMLPVLFPLLRPGFFVSDDGRFHVYRVAALVEAWDLGVFYPRLFPEFGFGYGQAVLNFYSPLSYLPAGLLALVGLSPPAAMEVSIAVAFLLAGLAAFGYARYLWGPLSGLLAGLAYTYFPYHLADAYFRGAVPEHWALVFPPLILWAYTAAFREEDARAPLLWGGLAWAGLVMTHNLSALLMVPVALLHLLLMAGWTGRWRRLLGAAGSLLLAMGLSAIYWLPVLAESGAVGISGEPSRGFEDHLLALGELLSRHLPYVYRDEAGFGLVYPLDWITAGLLLVAGVLLAWRYFRRRPPAAAPLLAFHLGLALVAILMLADISVPLWNPLLPLLGFLQYPWRFLVLANLGLLAAAAALPVLLPRVRPAFWAAGLAVLVMINALPGVRLESLSLPAADTSSPDRMWREDAEMGQVGATWTGEFLPQGVSEQRWALGRAREDAVDGPAPAPVPSVTVVERTFDSYAFEVAGEKPFALRLHQFFLPGWNAAVDGRPAPTYGSSEMALVTVDVPAGEHRVSVGFGATPARTAGSLLSLVAVLAWVALVWLRGREQRGLVAAAAVLMLLTLILALNSLGLGRDRWTPRPSQARLEDVAVLIGVDSAPARGLDAVDVTLYWLALRETATDYKAFVHLVGEDGAVVGQHDGDPVGGFTPTSRWRPGQVVADRHRIPLAADLPDASYGIRAGLYELLQDGIRNLEVDPPTADGRVDLGSIDVRR